MTAKPIPGKAYGSIPHFPGSRMGPADHCCEAGWAEISCGVGRRLDGKPRDRVIVTEKLDGACTAVARVEGKLLALMRAGYLAESSPYDHIRLFSLWLGENEDRFGWLPESHRVVGEWMAIACGTIYQLAHEPFAPFDVIEGVGRHAYRLPHDDARVLIGQSGLTGASVLHDGGPLAISDALQLLGRRGHHGAQEKPEGVVYRVETDGRFNFMAKWVDPEKTDGKYLPEISGSGAIIQWSGAASLT